MSSDISVLLLFLRVLTTEDFFITFIFAQSLFAKILLSFWIHKISLSNTQFQPFLGGKSLSFLILCSYSKNGLSFEDL